MKAVLAFGDSNTWGLIPGTLYDNKICTGDEAAECIRCMTLRVSRTGYQVVESRGDHIRYRKEAENG